MKTATLSRWMMGGLVCLFLSSPHLLFSQQKGWLGELTKEDSAAINALVLYPDTIRISILEAARYPEAIVRTALLQQNTSKDFIAAISSYSQEEQEIFWDLTRFPGLIDQLGSGEKKSAKSIKEIVAAYPEEIQEDALEYGTKKYEALHEISEMQNKSSLTFDEILKNYPPAAQHAFKELVYFPEVLSILNDHLQMTVLMGDMYNREPQWVIQTIDSLSLVVARQNAAELEEWKKNIEQDTALQNDMKQAANTYAKDNGNGTSDYNNPPPEDYISNYQCYPYSYWFGYPYWYPYYYWYPYPYWFDWGFYFNPFGSMIIFGMPSYHFTYWYFYHPNYYYDYPYLGNAYVNHYYGPRGGVSDNAGVVRDWMHGNSAYLPKDFATASGAVRVNAIRQLGKFEVDWRRQNALTPVSRNDFLNKNKSSYPDLNARNPEVKQDQRQAPSVIIERAPPAKQPAAKMPVTGTLEKNTGKVPSKYDFNKVQPAQEYHKSIWERTQPTPTQPRVTAPSSPQNRQPAVRTKPR